MKYLTLLITIIATLTFSACNNGPNSEEQNHSHEEHEHGDREMHSHDHNNQDEHNSPPEQEEFEIVPDSITAGQELHHHSDDHEHKH